MRRWSAVAVIVLLAWTACSAWGAPAGSAPPEATFDKDGWDLHFTYPSAWQPVNQGRDWVLLADGGTSQVFLVTRNRMAARRNQGMDRVFADATRLAGARLAELTVGDETAADLPGVVARRADWTAYDEDNEADIAGRVWVVTVAGATYAAIGGGPANAWEDDAALFDEVMAGLVGAQLAAGPTASPSGAHGRGKGPSGTPAPARPLRAREAYEIALPAAQAWREGAVLDRMSCLDDSKGGRCDHWSIVFAANVAGSSPGYQVEVVGGKVDGSLSRDLTVDDETRLPEDWIDSTDALFGFLDHGGSEFMDRHPNARVGLSMRSTYSTPDWTWYVDAEDGEDDTPGARWSVQVKAGGGAVDVTPGAGEEREQALTAREAVEEARTAGGVAADAEVAELLGLAWPGGPGYDEGRCTTWYVDFHWEEVVEGELLKHTYEVRVTDGQPIEERDSWLHLESIVGEWGDSPEALDTFRAAADYADFAARFPEHLLTYKLVSGKEGAPLWEVSAEVEGVQTSVRFAPPEG